MKLLRIIFNKYVLTTVAFLGLIIFFDQNDIMGQRQRQKELQDIRRNISFLKEEIARMDKDYRALTTDPEELERYAREHYRMKRDSEDVYIVEKK